MTLKITIALWEVEENQEGVAFEEMMRRQYNGAKFDTTQCRSIQNDLQGTIQHNTIQSIGQQLRPGMTYPGGDDGGALLLLGGHCHNVTVTTSLLQHYGPVHNVQFVKYDVTVSFYDAVSDTG